MLRYKPLILRVDINVGNKSATRKLPNRNFCLTLIRGVAMKIFHDHALYTLGKRRNALLAKFRINFPSDLSSHGKTARSGASPSERPFFSP